MLYLSRQEQVATTNNNNSSRKVSISSIIHDSGFYEQFYVYSSVPKKIVGTANTIAK